MFTQEEIAEHRKWVNQATVERLCQEAALDIQTTNSALSFVPPTFLENGQGGSPLEVLRSTVRNLVEALRGRGTLFDQSTAFAGRAWSDIAEGAYETYRISKGGSSLSWDQLHGSVKNAWEAAVRQAADGSAPSSWSGWQSNTRYHRDIKDAEPGAVYDTANGRIVQMHAHSKEPGLYMLGETIDSNGETEIVKYLRNGIPCSSHGHEWRIVGRRLDLEF